MSKFIQPICWVLPALCAVLIDFTFAYGQSKNARFDYSALKLPNGQSVTFDYRGPKLEKATEDGDRFGNRYGTWFGVFKDYEEPNAFLMLRRVSSTNHALALVRFRSQTEKPEILIETRERLSAKSLQFYQDQRGDIFIVSNEGLIQRFYDFEKVQRFALDGYYQQITKKFLPIELFPFDGGIVFYSNVPIGYEGKALREPIIYHDGKFEPFDLGGVSLTRLNDIGNNRAAMVNSDGVFQLDLKTRKLTKLAAETPTVEGNSLSMISYLEVGERKFGVFRNPLLSGHDFDAYPFNDGFYSKVGELIDGKWEMKEPGLDTKLQNFSHSIAIDSENRVWIAGNSKRLMMIDKDGTAKSFGTERGIQFTADSIEAHDSELILRSNPNSTQTGRRATNILLTRLLLEPRKVPSGWTELQMHSIFISNLQDELYGFGRENGMKLIKISSNGIEQIPLPEKTKMKFNHFVSMTFDSENNFWAYGRSHQDRTAIYEGGQWTVYKPKRGDQDQLASKHVALMDQIGKRNLKGSGYRVGSPYSKNCVKFENNEIVYLRDRKSFDYFDGKQWHQQLRPQGLPYYLPAEPFLEDENIAVPSRQNIYLVDKSTLINSSRVGNKPSWTFLKGREPKDDLRRKYAGYPQFSWKPNKQELDKDFARPRRRFGGFYTQSKKKFAFAPNFLPYVFIDREGTPLEHEEFEFVNAVGRFAVVRSRESPEKHFVYEFPKSSLRIIETNLGSIKTEKETVLPMFTIEPPTDNPLWRYRLEGDEWSAWTAANKPIRLRAIRERGTHRLELQVHAIDRLMERQTLTYEFKTEYSLATIIDDAIARLDDSKFATREKATKDLIEMGLVVIPDMQKLIEKGNPELTDRAESIIKAIRSGDKN